MGGIIKIVELFAGIGTQHMALENIGIKAEVKCIAEWYIDAILAYGSIHYSGEYCKDSTIEEMHAYLISLGLSRNSFDPAKKLNGFSDEKIIELYTYCKHFNNKGSVHNVSGNDILGVDLLTYSFPCTDLSTGGKGTGIKRGNETRSGLLWEVERILNEVVRPTDLPKVLLMENVPPILSNTHRGDFEEWCSFLERKGYKNYVMKMKGSDYGVPQKRDRVFMVSSLSELNIEIEKYKNQATSENVLKLNYSDNVILNEANEAALRNTPSREKMWETNKRVIGDPKPFNTITTNMDRQNNAGMILFEHGDADKPYRLLTAREAWMLMGINEQLYEKVRSEQNLSYRKMVKLAGNAIIVDILEIIFREVFYENKLY